MTTDSPPTRVDDAAVRGALLDTRGNITDAARLLGIARQTVYDRVQRSADLRKALRETRSGQTDDAADVVISTRVTPDVARAIDQRRGSMTRSQYLRHMLQQIAAQPSAR